MSASVVNCNKCLICVTVPQVLHDDLDIHFNHRKSNLIKFGHDYKDNIDT